MRFGFIIAALLLSLGMSAGSWAASPRESAPGGIGGTGNRPDLPEQPDIPDRIDVPERPDVPDFSTTGSEQLQPDLPTLHPEQPTQPERR